VYFGTTSGDYDSLHQVYATCDTLRNLEEDTTYFITVTAINADGFESIADNEVSQTPMVVTLDQGIIVVPTAIHQINYTLRS